MASYNYSSVAHRIEPGHFMIHTTRNVAWLESRRNYRDHVVVFGGMVCVLGEMVHDFI
jgi:hypothetical protein